MQKASSDGVALRNTRDSVTAPRPRAARGPAHRRQPSAVEGNREANAALLGAVRLMDDLPDSTSTSGVRRLFRS